MGMTKADRDWNESRRKVYKKISKPVKWNGETFESIRALARFHGEFTGSNIHRAIREKRPYRGHMVERL